MADDFDSIVAKIMERTGLSRDRVMEKIRSKHAELGIITWEGAARMVADELEGRG